MLVRVNEDVLGLDVAVGVAFLEDVGHGGDYLPEEAPGLRLAQPVPVHDVVEQLAAGAILRHHENSVVLNYLQNKNVKNLPKL